jgi:CBS domain-containing protein
LGLSADTDVPRAAEYMQKHGIHRVLVMDGERLLGIATTSDISDGLSSASRKSVPTARIGRAHGDQQDSKRLGV